MPVYCVLANLCVLTFVFRRGFTATWLRRSHREGPTSRRFRQTKSWPLDLILHPGFINCSSYRRTYILLRIIYFVEYNILLYILCIYIYIYILIPIQWRLLSPERVFVMGKGPEPRMTPTLHLYPHNPLFYWVLQV